LDPIVAKWTHLRDGGIAEDLAGPEWVHSQRISSSPDDFAAGLQGMAWILGDGALVTILVIKTLAEANT
jgi:hypothetical protein